MGLFKIRAKVFRLEDERNAVEVDLTVDTGATYPVIPQRTAEQLGIHASETRTFTLAVGGQVQRQLGWAGISYDGRSCPTLVILGEPDDVAVLGAVALEGLGFEADPIAKTLRPVAQYFL